MFFQASWTILVSFVLLLSLHNGPTAQASDSLSFSRHPFAWKNPNSLVNYDDDENGNYRRPTSKARIVQWQMSDENNNNNKNNDDDDEQDELDRLLPTTRRWNKRRQTTTWAHEKDLDPFPTLSNQEDDDQPDFTTKRSSSLLSLHLEESSFSSVPHSSHSSHKNKKYKKTGTTIAGCVVQNHVILAADTRATEGTMVADKTCQKLHPIASNCWCCGAGTSADLDHLTNQCLYTHALQSLQESTIGNDYNHNNNDDDEENAEEEEERKILLTLSSSQQTDKTTILYADNDDANSDALLLLRPVSIGDICNFFQNTLYQARGHIGANLILGNVWNGQAHLCAIHPHGSMDMDLPFAALGSGGLAAMGVLEQGYNINNNNNMTVQEGIVLVQRAILAGIRNDLGSGSQVDLCIIYPDGSSRLQRCVVPEEILEEMDDLGSFAAAAAAVESSSDDGGGGGGDALLATDEKEPLYLGVNGFGNLPFSVRSRKTILSDATEEERLSKWNELLGLGK